MPTIISVLSIDILHCRTNQRLAPSGDFKETLIAPQKKVIWFCLDARPSRTSQCPGKYPLQTSRPLPSTMANTPDHAYREQPGLSGVLESNTSAAVRSGFIIGHSVWPELNFLEQYPQQHIPFYRRRNGIIIIILIIIIVIGAIVGGGVGGSALTAQRDGTTAAAVPIITTVTTTTITVTSSAPSPSPSNCVWEGSAPFCDGKCHTGFTQMKEDNCGGGACCSTGFKVYCCQQWNFGTQLERLLVCIVIQQVLQSITVIKIRAKIRLVTSNFR